jgi:hypothetical protein
MFIVNQKKSILLFLYFFEILNLLILLNNIFSFLG